MTGPAAPMPREEAAALLGVPGDASPAEVQRAYLRAARRTHPDVLTGADEAARRAAGDAFDRLTRARGVLLEPPAAGPASAPPGGGWTAGPEGAAGPMLRPVPGRGIGGSLVVLVLLAFLLVALVTAQQAFRGDAFDTPGSSVAPTAGP